MAELRARELAAFGLGVLATLGAVNAGVVHARLVPSGSMAPTIRASALSAATAGSSSATTSRPPGTRSRRVQVRTPSSPRLGRTSAT